MQNRFFITIVFGFLLSATFLQAQELQEESSTSIFRTGTSNILLNATVRVGSEPVTHLTRENFAIFEDGVPQRITYFSRDYMPLSLSVVLDVSNSMSGEGMSYAYTAVNYLLSQLRMEEAEDEVAIHTFNHVTEVTQDWTNDRYAAIDSLENTQTSGGSALFDAVSAGVNAVMQRPRQRKVVLVISDGEEAGDSGLTLSELKEQIQASSVIVHAIGIDNGSRNPIQEDTLRTFSEDTGGRWVVARRNSDIIRFLSEVYGDIQVQYTLGYADPNHGDGNWHEISVSAYDPAINQPLTVQTRTGYRALVVSTTSLNRDDSWAQGMPIVRNSTGLTDPANAFIGDYTLKNGVVVPGAASDLIFSSGIDVVYVTATVTDRRRRFVGGLSQEDFQIFDDGVEQAITSFSRERTPVSLGIIVDVSASMQGHRLKVAEQATQNLLAALRNGTDEAFIITFSDSIFLYADWTTNTGALEAQVKRSGFWPMDSTSLYDAIVWGIQNMKNARHRKKVLFVISDGNDNDSSNSLPTAQEAVLRSEVLLYAIGSHEPIDRGREQLDIDILRNLSADTGGRAERIDSFSRLLPFTQSVAREISQQYELSYTPNPLHWDGQWHTIEVKIDNPRYDVRSRRGYFSEAK